MNTKKRRVPLLCLQYLPALLVVLMFSVAVRAAPLVEVNQTRVNMDLSPYVDVLEDASGQLTIADVTSARFAFQFASVPLTELFFGYTSSAYWIRFTVENQRDIDTSFVLNVSPVDINYLDLFEVNTLTGALRQRVSSGSSRVFEARQYDHPLYLFDLPVDAYTARSYYLRVASNKTLNLELNLSTPREHLHNISVRDGVQGALLGCLFWLTLAHLALFFLFRYRAFLWCSLCLLAITLLQISWDGYLLRYFTPNDLLLDRQLLVCIYLSLLCAKLFAQSLLDTRRRAPWQHHTLSALAVFCGLAAIASLFIHPSVNAIVAASTAGVSMLLVFIFTMHANMAGLPMARHFLLARTVTSGIVLLSIVTVYGYWPQSSFMNWGMPLAIIIEAMIMAIAMTATCLSALRQQQVFALNQPVKHPQRALINLADICHEVRTPISGILGMSDLLLDGNLSEQQRKQVKTVRKSGQALLDVTHKIVDLSMIESGQAVLHCMPFDLDYLVECCVENCRARAESNNIELIYWVDSKTERLVKGDQEKVQQILINLLHFALRHLEFGAITLSVSPLANRQTQFSLRACHSAQGSTTQSETRALSASDQLNLTIAEQYIQLMQGILAVRQHIGGGVTMDFCLTLEAQAGVVVHDDERVLRGKRLLIVDNSTYCAIIGQQAMQWGMQVISAQGGKEALAILRSRTTLDEPFDAVLLDYDIPTMTGVELAANIRIDNHIDSKKLLIIMLTGASKAQGEIMADNTDIQSILYKPLSGKSLKQALQATLQQYLQAA